MDTFGSQHQQGYSVSTEYRFQPVDEALNGVVHNSELDSVLVSPSGGLWFSTRAAGLLLWKEGRLTSFTDRRCTPALKMGGLVEDLDGSLWIQASGALYRMHGSVCEQAGARQNYPGGFPAAILMDRDGTFWAESASGSLLFMPRGQSRFQLSPKSGTATVAQAFLHQAPDGSIWLSDDYGLRRVKDKAGSPALSPPTDKDARIVKFGDFTFADDGSLWAATGKGIERFDDVAHWQTPRASASPSGQMFTPDQGLSSDAVWRLLIDREGTIWTGTNSGLDRLRRTPLTTLTLPHIQEHEFSIAPGDRGAVWIGNQQMPLTRVTPDGTLTSFPQTRRTICIRRDHNGTIWSDGDGDFHLWRFDGTRLSPLHYPEEKLGPDRLARGRSQQ